MTIQEKLESKNRLPELNAIDNSLNHYARALLSEIPGLRKIWTNGAHLHYKNGFDNKYICCSNSPVFEKALEDQQIDSEIKMASHIINFNTKENYAVSFPNVQNYWDRLDNRVYLRMDKDKSFYWISRDNMETWQKKSVRKFNMVKHKNGETSELDCFLNVSLTALCFNKIKNDRSLKVKGGKQGLKVHVCFDNANGYTEEIKTALDAFKIIKAHTDYKFQLRKFHNDLKTNCANNQEWSIVSSNSKFCIILSLPCINYKYNLIINNNEKNLNLEDTVFIVNAQSANDKIKKSPEETWPENFKEVKSSRRQLKKSDIEYEQTKDDPLYTEWKKHCKFLNNDPEKCWTFEEYKKRHETNPMPSELPR
jgi:hypothetical protein